MDNGRDARRCREIRQTRAGTFPDRGSVSRSICLNRLALRIQMAPWLTDVLRLTEPRSKSSGAAHMLELLRNGVWPPFSH